MMIPPQVMDAAHPFGLGRDYSAMIRLGAKSVNKAVGKGRSLRGARFHPDYSDIGRHRHVMGERLGLGPADGIRTRMPLRAPATPGDRRARRRRYRTRRLHAMDHHRSGRRHEYDELLGL